MKRILLALVMCSQNALGNIIQLGSDIDGEASGDISGSSVSLSADSSVVAIGAPYNDDNGNSSGHVRLYQWDDSSWNQLGSDIDGEAMNDYFGASVSLSADGSVVAIGAYGNDGNGSNSGHVRLYEWNGSSWNQLGSDIDGEASDDQSGSSVSLSADGTVVAIGARYNDGNGSNSGHVRLYEWDGTSWNQLGSDIDGEAEYDQSGSSISLSADGTVVAIGARYNDGNGGYHPGHVRLYEWNGSSWNQLGSDIDGRQAGGEDVEYFWGLGSQYGYSVSLSADGTIVAIGAHYGSSDDSEPGYVVFYEWDGSSWNWFGGISGEDMFDDFGHSLSLSADGSIVAIGASNYNAGNGSGYVRLYQWDGTSWNQLSSDINGEDSGDDSGSSVSLSADGSVVAIGAYRNDGNGNSSGHVRVYYNLVDSDNDGLSDRYEAMTSNTDPNDSDSDDDGLSDGDEVNTYGTDPNGSDSDGDGLSDGDEVNTYITDPNLDDDKDLDGLLDAEEIITYATDPNNSDSDGDGFNDGNEISMGLDPNIFDLKPISNIDIFYECSAGESVTIYSTPTNGSPTNFTYQWVYDGFLLPSFLGGTYSNYTIIGSTDYNGNWSVLVSNTAGTTTNNFIFEVFTDNDQDGLSNGRETYVVSTNPNSADSDGDGLSDGYEVYTSSTDPNNSDSDGDGLSDGDEVNTYITDPNLDDDKDLDGLLDAEEIITYATDPNNSDSDGDGLSDGYEVYTSLTDPNNSDSDGDGLSDGDEVNTYGTDPNGSDSDGDGLSDGDEVNTYTTDPNLDDDKDLDGLLDAEEVNTYSSNPNNRDSDGDGFDDGFEVTIASNVFSPTSADNSIIDYIKARPDLFDLSADGMTMSEAQAAMRDLRIGSQTFNVSNGTATIRMYVDESSDLTSSWTNTQHVLEVDIPADQDTMFYRFRMD